MIKLTLLQAIEKWLYIQNAIFQFSSPILMEPPTVETFDAGAFFLDLLASNIQKSILNAGE